MEIKFKHLIVPIMLVIALAGGLYTYQKQNQDKESSFSPQSSISDKTSGIILGDSDSTNNSGLGLNDNTSNTSSQITTGEIYLAKINEIRNPIIKDINELNSRMKYKNVFDDGAIISYTNEIIEKNKSAIEKIRNLNIDSKFSAANKKNIQSLQSITEALGALKKSYTVEDKTEAQKQKELFAYNLEQSDNIYKGIQIPK